MSKSYGNAIFLGDAVATVGKKVDAMLTDPQRTHRHIPGNPDVCPVFANHRVFSSPETIAWSDRGCRTAEIGCRDCKAALRASLCAKLAPIATRRAELAERPEHIDEILRAGADVARGVAARTLDRVRRAMRIQG
jgi:tryptophanyl-tRNA synthetase